LQHIFIIDFICDEYNLIDQFDLFTMATCKHTFLRTMT